MASLAAQRCIPVQHALLKQVERARVRVPLGVVAVGSVPFVHHALRQVGRMLPDSEPYPLALQPLLYRRVRKLRTLQEARSLLALGERLFVRPAVGWKRFSGFVPEIEDDPRFNGASGSAPVWVSEVVRFVSEWRAYVANDVLLDVRFVDHGGARELPPDRAVIEQAVETLASSRGAPAGYVMDFGVLDTGETALVEMNDGFAFGAYDHVSAEVYWAVTVSRWWQLSA